MTILFFENSVLANTAVMTAEASAITSLSMRLGQNRLPSYELIIASNALESMFFSFIRTTLQYRFQHGNNHCGAHIHGKSYQKTL